MTNLSQFNYRFDDFHKYTSGEDISIYISLYNLLSNVLHLYLHWTYETHMRVKPPRLARSSYESGYMDRSIVELKMTFAKCLSPRRRFPKRMQNRVPALPPTSSEEKLLT